MIRAHVDEQQDDWDIGLSQLCFSYNSSVHETTGVSPFYVMFGRESIIPVDLVYPNRVELTGERITEAKLVPIEELVDIEIEKDGFYPITHTLKKAYRADSPPDTMDL
jgi:hypothetical protein